MTTEQKMPRLVAELPARPLSLWERAGVRVSASPEWERPGEDFQPPAENKETPGPLNRKRSRKGSRGQHPQSALLGRARQTNFHAAHRLVCS